MDSGLDTGLQSTSKDDVREKGDPTSLVDSDMNQISGAPNFSFNADVAPFVHEEASMSQEASSADKDGMDIDSESTYSCLNSSSDEKSIDSGCAHELTTQNGEHENQSPKTSSSDNGTGTSSDNHLGQVSTSDAPSDSVQVIKDETGEYIVPKLGVEYESEDHAYKCYNRYALMEGFSIRKDFVNRSKVTGLVVSRRYTCHRQGYGSSTKRDANVNKPRKETRTGCLAHMTITRQTNGNYRVIHFERRHNHELVTPFTAHLLPSQKRISFVETVEAGSDAAATSAPDGVPKLGMGFDSEDLAYEFYNTYAGRVGFSVRKDYVNRSKVDGAVASRRYTCFREGYRQNDKRGSNVKRPRKETRVGCMAQLVISRQVDGRYRITHFEEGHNHDLVPACKVRTLRSQKRSMTNQNVESSSSVGAELQPKSLAELLLTGVDCFYDPIDHEMRLTSKRAYYIKQEEAESLHQYFLSKKLKEPSFVYAVQVDVEEEMTNFFWADEKMVVDYGDFGDVVYFNTTYFLNKDSRPLVLFFGINNHKQILVFGAAFVYHDTVESFKWLFRTFVKAMSGKTPKTILSDKDAVITEAIVSELPETYHRLCTWQIYQNTVKHLSQARVNSDSFSSDLCCGFFNLEEEDFVNSWKRMLDTCRLWENEFLRGIFEEREKLATPYNKHIFAADIESALISEGSITSLRKYLKPESNVLQFVKHFGRVVNEWRYKELEANYDMSHHLPKLMGDVIVLKQVREVYTPVIFKTFHQEYENCLNNVINECIDNGSSVEFKVSAYGQVRQYAVLYSLEDDSVVCSCMKFQFVGILCSHALKVLDYRNIKIVPSRYILKRWTRDARA